MDTSSWTRVLTEDGGLSLRLPPGWQVEPGSGGDDVLIASPRDATEPVLLVNRASETYASAKDCKTGNVVGLQSDTSLRDYTDHGGGEWAIGGRDISWHSYSYATGDGRRLRVLFYCLFASGSAYVVTCAAREDHFDAHRPTLEAIGRGLEPATSPPG